MGRKHLTPTERAMGVRWVLRGLEIDPANEAEKWLSRKARRKKEVEYPTEEDIRLVKHLHHLLGYCVPHIRNSLRHHLGVWEYEDLYSLPRWKVLCYAWDLVTRKMELPPWEAQPFLRELRRKLKEKPSPTAGTDEAGHEE